MSFLPSLKSDAVLLDVFRRFPDTAAPLLEVHQRLLRGPSPLTSSQRELIAAYVSALNACGYCHGVHAATAEALGVEPGTLEALLADLDTAPVEEAMRPLLRFLGKLTREPSRVTEADAGAVLDAGWDETALHDAVAVCALFSFMNRYVQGLGITAGEDYFQLASRRLSAGGYRGLQHLLDRPDEAPRRGKAPSRGGSE